MSVKRFAIKTLGCKVNQYEEQVVRENLVRLGFQEADPREADIFIVNSCTVTGRADLKTRKLLRKVKRDNPDVKIFVTGCYAVLREDIKQLESFPEVDVVVPGNEKKVLPLVIDSFFGGGRSDEEIIERVSGFSSHTRAFLKVQDGCDQRCSYCKVNIVRGPSVSRDESEVLDEVTRLAGAGYGEIVLTGICLGSWRGSGRRRISHLVKEIDALDGDFRIRLSSLEPNHIDDALIKTISASRNICRHLHVPLQSGSDRILRAMNRKYTTGQFRRLVDRIRKLMPLAGLTMDIIVGFPGEKSADFEKTLKFVREVQPSRLHVFRYSDRKGTPSFDITDKVPVNTAKHRVNRLISAGKKLQVEFCKKFVGRTVDVLVEERTRGTLLEGYTGEYLRARLEGFEGAEGDIISIQGDSVDEKTLCLLAKNPEKTNITAAR